MCAAELPAEGAKRLREQPGLPPPEWVPEAGRLRAPPGLSLAQLVAQAKTHDLGT